MGYERMDEVILKLPHGGFFHGLIIGAFQRLNGERCLVAETPSGQMFVGSVGKFELVNGEGDANLELGTAVESSRDVGLGPKMFAGSEDQNHPKAPRTGFVPGWAKSLG